jgi:uncharacterized protein (DUF4415 family)
MNGNKRALGSDLEKVDSHVIQPEEYDDIPELTEEWFAQADLHEGGKLVRRGRPPKEAPKIPVTIRLDADLVERLRNSGQGWQSRINDTLRKAAGL